MNTKDPFEEAKEGLDALNETMKAVNLKHFRKVSIRLAKQFVDPVKKSKKIPEKNRKAFYEILSELTLLEMDLTQPEVKSGTFAEPLATKKAMELIRDIHANIIQK